MKLETQKKIKKAQNRGSHASCFMLHASCSRGFSLLELMMVMAITLIVSALILWQYHAAGTVGTLDRAANKVAQDIRSAEGYSLSSESYGSPVLPPCGFGVHAPDPSSGDPNSYIIYAKYASATTVPCGVAGFTYSRQWKGSPECFNAALAPTACPGAYNITTMTLKKFVLYELNSVKFSFNTFDDIYFEPPDPTTYIYTASPGTSTTLAVTNSFQLEALSNAALTRTVRVENSGRVQVIGEGLFGG